MKAHPVDLRGARSACTRQVMLIELLQIRRRRLESGGSLTIGELRALAASTSAKTRRRYGIALVCRAWSVSRSTFYRREEVERRCAGDRTPPRSSVFAAPIEGGPPRKSGRPSIHPNGAVFERIAELHCRARRRLGYRTYWRLLRADGFIVSKERVRRTLLILRAPPSIEPSAQAA